MRVRRWAMRKKLRPLLFFLLSMEKRVLQPGRCTPFISNTALGLLMPVELSASSPKPQESVSQNWAIYTEQIVTTARCSSNMF